MAGSKRWFAYTLDDGTSVGILADESNVEAVNGAASNTPIVGSRPTRGAPKGTRLRFISYKSDDGLRTVRIPVLNTTIYGAIPAALQTIPNPITPGAGEGGGNLIFDYKRGEVSRIPKFGIDTGLTDGDKP